MDLIEDREPKRQRTVINPDGLTDNKGKAGQQLEDESIGKCEALVGAVEFLTDNDCEDDDNDIEGDYDLYDSRVAHMKRRPGYQDEIDQVAMEFEEQSDHSTSLFTYFPEGEWSQMGVLVQIISVKIVEGAGKFLFGKILSRNYRGDYLSFYNRDSNNCQLLDEKAVASLCSPRHILRIIDELDIFFDLSTKDSECSEEKEVGRGCISWQCMQMRPGIFSDVVPGMHGATRVTYAVICRAVEAVVSVVIIDRSVNNLHAKVVAIHEKFSKVVLFNGVLDDEVPAGEESILLGNSVLAVSKDDGQKLEIKVSLWNDKVGKISYCATFSPKLRSCDTAFRKVSRYGAFRIKVAWSVVPLSPERFQSFLERERIRCKLTLPCKL